MASLNINIPDNIYSSVIENIAYFHNYRFQKNESETEEQFAKRVIVQLIKEWCRLSEEAKAIEVAKDNASNLFSTFEGIG